MPAFALTLRRLAPWLLYARGLLLGGFLILGGFLMLTNAGEAILRILGGVAVAGLCFGLGSVADAANTYLDHGPRHG
jgi:hypothetical protein